MEAEEYSNQWAKYTSIAFHCYSSLAEKVVGGFPWVYGLSSPSFLDE